MARASSCSAISLSFTILFDIDLTLSPPVSHYSAVSAGEDKAPAGLLPAGGLIPSIVGRYRFPASAEASRTSDRNSDR